MGFGFRYVVPVDAVTGALGMIAYEHHAIHDGEMYHAVRRVTAGDNEERDILVVCGAKDVHTVFSFSSNVEVEVDLREAPTLTASGTLITPLNKDRGDS